MTEPLSELSIEALNDLSINAWSRNASYWDAAMGPHGNDFFLTLELPALQRLVAPLPSQRVLDLGTGNGLVARWLASHGCRVIAADASAEILGAAMKRCTEEGVEDVQFTVLDATREEQLGVLVAEEEGRGAFEAVVANMVLMDIPTIIPLASALPGLLKRNGVFVATVLHPAFTSSGATRHISVGENPSTGRQEIQRSINVSQYLRIPPVRGEAIAGQPAAQLYFNRTISELFAPFFAAGLVLDGLEELGFPEAETEMETGVERVVESFRNFTQIPLILAFRFRRVD